MYRRLVEPGLLAALEDTPCVAVHGPRQSGKTTLVRDILPGLGWKGRYFTLDDASVLAAATSDPGGFVDGLREPCVVDEIQRAPALLPAIKASVDRDRRPGRFVLTGSADALAIPRLADSLVGRVEILTLWPLCQAEIEGRAGTFVADLFDGHRPAGAPCTVRDVLNRLVAGGFPEAVGRPATRRHSWFASYLGTILRRDVRELARVQGLAEMPRLVALLAARSGGLLNRADLARDAGLPASTLERYLSLLEAIFLFRLLPAWHANLGKRLVKAPKVIAIDTGLAAHALGADRAGIEALPILAGPLTETFVITEVLKLMAATPGTSAFHFRTHSGDEVDLVLEDPSGRIVGIEVKTSTTIRSEAFRGLRALQDACGKRFVQGIVLHPGAEAVPFGNALSSVPLSSLWAPSGGAGRPRPRRAPRGPRAAMRRAGRAPA